MKKWTRIFALSVLAVCTLSVLPRTISFARSLRALSGLRMVNGESLGPVTSGNSRYDAYITQSARRHRIDPRLMYALIRQESGFKNTARSPVKAAGLTQLMPDTARMMGVKNVYDPRQNIEGGTKYLRRMLNLFKGDLRLALAGYNAGPGRVIKSGYRVPNISETQNYVVNIGSHYSNMRPNALAKGR